MRSVDLALDRLRNSLRLRGVLDVVERICAHHGVTLLSVAAFDGTAEGARRDVMRALRDRNITMLQLASMFGSDLEEIGNLLVADRGQQRRIALALGGGLS